MGDPAVHNPHVKSWIYHSHPFVLRVPQQIPTLRNLLPTSPFHSRADPQRMPSLPPLLKCLQSEGITRRPCLHKCLFEKEFFSKEAFNGWHDRLKVQSCIKKLHCPTRGKSVSLVVTCGGLLRGSPVETAAAPGPAQWLWPALHPPRHIKNHKGLMRTKASKHQ